MKKTQNGRLAIASLKMVGVEVIEDWGDEVTEFGELQFAIASKSSGGDDVYFDMPGGSIRESFVNGEYINSMGVRQDIIEILTKHQLEFDFHDRGTLEVWDMFPEHKQVQSLKVESKLGERPMSEHAFLAFKELARNGAPVWDFDSYSSRYDPTTLPGGTQFVMDCEPRYDDVFADHIADEIKQFTETQGLRPSVFEITSKYGLEPICHLHRYEEARFQPKRLIAFIDPQAGAGERGKL